MGKNDEPAKECPAPDGSGPAPEPGADPVKAPGRPRLSGEALKVVAFKLPESELLLLDARAALNGQTRSQRLRMLVERDVDAPFVPDAPAS